jgi:hypothetical protein
MTLRFSACLLLLAAVGAGQADAASSYQSRVSVQHLFAVLQSLGSQASELVVSRVPAKHLSSCGSQGVSFTEELAVDKCTSDFRQHSCRKFQLSLASATLACCVANACFDSYSTRAP